VGTTSRLRATYLTGDVEVQLRDTTEGAWSYDGEPSEAPKYVVDALGLNDPCGNPSCESRMDVALVSLNDKGSTFSEIADILEANPEHYFKAIPAVQTGDE
jgi:hypothetical protein